MTPPRIQRAAFLLTWASGNEPSAGDGVRRKIGAQVRRWRSLGITIRLFINARRDCRRAWLEEVEPSELFVSVGMSRVERWRSLRRVSQAIEDFAPDFLYLRQELFSPQLGRLMERWPSFVELNGDDVAEAQQMPARQAYYWVYRALSRGAFLSRAVGLVAVSHELANLRPFARHGLPTTVIGNGIDLSRFEPLPAPATTTMRFGFLGAALGAKWHGAAKILELARLRPEWTFDLIGMERRELEAPVPANVIAHGVLDRPQYERVLAACDVGIGTLAAYQKKAWEASPLKVRQYLAFGIPTVTGVTDTDFPDGADFLLVLPNTPDNIIANIPLIEAFARKWKGRRVPREDVTRLDFSAKEVRRIEFVKDVLQSRAIDT
jgi:hypothetical protein